MGQKEGQIYMLEREISNQREELDEVRLTYRDKIEDMDAEQN